MKITFQAINDNWDKMPIEFIEQEINSIQDITHTEINLDLAHFMGAKIELTETHIELSNDIAELNETLNILSDLWHTFAKNDDYSPAKMAVEAGVIDFFDGGDDIDDMFIEPYLLGQALKTYLEMPI